jgi:hypothetical protein
MCLIAQSEDDVSIVGAAQTEKAELVYTATCRFERCIINREQNKKYAFTSIKVDNFMYRY